MLVLFKIIFCGWEPIQGIVNLFVVIGSNHIVKDLVGRVKYPLQNFAEKIGV